MRQNLGMSEAASRQSQGSQALKTGMEIISGRSSQVSHHQSQHDSQHSKSIASKHSKSSKNLRHGLSPVARPKDEWAEITRFNALLHQEEQRQIIRENEQRRKLIKQELDRQVKEKRQRKKRE